MNIVIAGNTGLTETDLKSIFKTSEDKFYFCSDEDTEIPIAEKDVDAIVCNWFFKYHELSKFSNLKYIQLLSAGYNGIDPEEVRGKSIALYNAKNIYSIPISEFVLGTILAYYKKFDHFFRNKANHKWEKIRQLPELHDKKVLIVGTGSIGTEIAKRMKGFTDFVFGCNRTVVKKEFFTDIFPLSNLLDIIPEMDIIILSIALTRETFHLIDETMINKMKRGTLIVNISRGSIIDQNPLINSLSKDEIGGAILDVFEEEPLDEKNPLWDMENVLITPHNAFASERNTERIKKMILANFQNWRDSNHAG